MRPCTRDPPSLHMPRFTFGTAVHLPALTAARNLVQAHGVEAGDPTAAHMLQVGARVCKLLQER